MRRAAPADPPARPRLAARAGVRGAGRTLTWVSTDPAALDRIAAVTPGGTTTGERTGTAVETRQPERTLLRAPGGYAPAGGGFTLHVRLEEL